MGFIGVITNPYAKKNSKLSDRVERFSEILGDSGEVHQTDQLDQIDQVCQRFLDKDPDLIAICGGDGTNHLVFTDLIRVYLEAGKPLPPVHFLLGGSMNTIAWNNGLKQPAEKTLSDLVEKLKAGTAFQTVRQSTIKVNRWYGFFFGNGYAVNFLDEYYNSKFESGPGRAAQITFQAISSILAGGDMFKRLARQTQAELFVDGKPVDGDSFGMVMASFIAHIGLGFKPLYRARESEDRFHLLITSLTPGAILAQIHRMYSGKRLVGEQHIDQLAAEVIIQAPKPIGYTLDGELYRDEELIITPGPVLDLVVD